MRQNDLQRGDPEQLARLRIRSSLQPDGDSLVYRRGSFIARIGPDGEVSFSRTRRVPGLGLSYETDRGSPQFLEMRRFLDATEDIRAEREARAGEITMRRALAHLGSELNELWRDSDLSVRQKKEILFQRLAECNLDTAGGREAAQIIVNFIRHHFRSVGG
jgi:hypothetical protein